MSTAARRTGHRAGTKVRGLQPSGEDSDSGRIRGRHGLPARVRPQGPFGAVGRTSAVPTPGSPPAGVGDIRHSIHTEGPLTFDRDRRGPRTRVLSNSPAIRATVADAAPIAPRNPLPLESTTNHAEHCPIDVSEGRKALLAGRFVCPSAACSLGPHLPRPAKPMPYDALADVARIPARRARSRRSSRRAPDWRDVA